MKLKDIFSIFENKMISGFKAWYHPYSGKSIILRPYQTHSSAIMDLKNYSNVEQAIKDGWVRLGTHKDSDLKIPESFVHADTTQSAFYGLRWLLNNDPDVGLEFFIETNDGLNWVKLSFNDAKIFAKTGKIPN